MANPELNPERGNIQLLVDQRGKPVEVYLNTTAFSIEGLKDLIELTIDNIKANPNREIEIRGEIPVQLSQSVMQLQKQIFEKSPEPRKIFNAFIDDALRKSDKVIIREVSEEKPKTAPQEVTLTEPFELIVSEKHSIKDRVGLFIKEDEQGLVIELRIKTSDLSTESLKEIMHTKLTQDSGAYNIQIIRENSAPIPYSHAFLQGMRANTEEERQGFLQNVDKILEDKETREVILYAGNQRWET